MKTKHLHLSAILLALAAQTSFGQSSIIDFSAFDSSGSIIIAGSSGFSYPRPSTIAAFHIANAYTWNIDTTTLFINDVGDFTMEGGARLNLQLGGAGRFHGYSGIDVHGSVDLDPNATIGLALINGYAPQNGDRFELLHFLGTISSATPQFDVPALDPGLFWDTSAFAQTGTLSVTATPEPASAALLGLGTLLLAARRRRSA